MEPMTSPTPPAVVDFLQKPITVGCKLVYPWRRGSSMGLHQMNVQQIDHSRDKPVIVGYTTTGRRVRISNTDTCVVVG